MNDDGGVLGRLPRSRPGTRSEKRATEERKASPAATPKAKPPRPKAAAPAKPAKAKAPRAGAAPRARKPATPPPRARPEHAAPPPERRGDPLSEALRAGAKVAEGGVKLAGGLTRELLRRIPRP